MRIVRDRDLRKMFSQVPILVMRIAVTICFIVFCAVLGACSKEDKAVDVPMPVTTPSFTPISATDDESDKPKIISFGDSLTAGFGFTDLQKSYPALLQQSLEREGFDYDVYNSGLPGDTTSGGLKRLWTALKYKNVKLYVLELGANDIVKKTPAVEITANLAEIIKQMKASGAKVILCGYVAPASLGDEYVSEIQEMYADLAKRNELPLIPDFMKDVGGNPERMLADGIHPNEKGAEIIEQNVRPFVKTLLAKNDESKNK